MEENLQLVEDCEARESRLDNWQREFIESIGRQLRQGRGLTAAQQDKLNEVWEHATAEG